MGKREREKREQKYLAVLGESVLHTQVIRHPELWSSLFTLGTEDGKVTLVGERKNKSTRELGGRKMLPLSVDWRNVHFKAIK